MKRLGMAVMFLALAAGAYGAWWWSQGGGGAGGKKGKGKGAVLTVKAARAVVKPMPGRPNSLRLARPRMPYTWQHLSCGARSRHC